MAVKKANNSNMTGKVSVADMRAMINKKLGHEVAYDLQETNPTEVIDWIPTGSRWLDSVICRGKMAGIPVGKLSELAGAEACVTEDTIIEVEIE